MLKIKTTHVGSLPRPPDLAPLLVARERGELHDLTALDATISRGVDDVVRRQVEIGIDVVNDGELGKIHYGAYVTHRFNGLSAVPRVNPLPLPRGAERYQTWGKQLHEASERAWFHEYACDGPVSIKDPGPLQRDLRNLRSAASKAGATELFMNAASPGLLANLFANRYYPSHEAYLAALVDVLRIEYETIVAADVILQIDSPDLTACASADGEAARERRKHLAVEAINAATAGIDPRRMRLHVCWGNAEAPHDDDLPIAQVFPYACAARPAAIAFAGANPRHEHEWTYFAQNGLPDDKLIVPGVIDCTTNFIEHPELVAQRIMRYVDAVGAERVIAGVDCGFALHTLFMTVDPDIAFAKLRALVDGVALANARGRSAALR